jgi:hypothetical protein
MVNGPQTKEVFKSREIVPAAKGVALAASISKHSYQDPNLIPPRAAGIKPVYQSPSPSFPKAQPNLAGVIGDWHGRGIE